MEIRWLRYSGSKRRHGFPVDEKKYGDWALCGRGSCSSKAEGNEHLCGKCLEILEKYSDEELESKRIALKRQTDFHEEHGP